MNYCCGINNYLDSNGMIYTNGAYHAGRIKMEIAKVFNPCDIMLEAINEFEVGFQLERDDQGE